MAPTGTPTTNFQGQNKDGAVMTVSRDSVNYAALSSVSITDLKAECKRRNFPSAICNSDDVPSLVLALIENNANKFERERSEAVTANAVKNSEIEQLRAKLASVPSTSGSGDKTQGTPFTTDFVLELAKIIKQAPTHLQFRPDTKIDEFHGKYGEDFGRWFARFEMISEPLNWDEKSKKIALTGSLRGEALDWQTSVGKHLAEYDDWLAAFKSKFDKKLDWIEWVTRIQQMKPDQGQTYVSFLLKKMALLDKCPNPIADKDKLGFAYINLPEAVHLSFITRDCKNLDEALNHAEKLDTRNRELGRSSEKPAEVSKNNKGKGSQWLSKEEWEARQLKRKEDQKNNSSSTDSKQQNPSNPNGSRYDKPLWKDQFPAKFNGSNVKEVNCYVCGKKGHVSYDCPNKKDDRSYQKPAWPSTAERGSYRGGYQDRGGFRGSYSQDRGSYKGGYIPNRGGFQTGTPVKTENKVMAVEQKNEAVAETSNSDEQNKFVDFRTAQNTSGVYCTFEVIKTPLAEIPIKLNGIPMKACDDHGSNLSFISQKYIPADQFKMIEPWNDAPLRAAGGLSFNPLGRLRNVKIQLGDTTTVIDMGVLEDNMVPVLLGDDFRAKSELKIICYKGTRCYQKFRNGKFECVVSNVENCKGCALTRIYDSNWRKDREIDKLRHKQEFRVMCASAGIDPNDLVINDRYEQYVKKGKDVTEIVKNEIADRKVKNTITALEKREIAEKNKNACLQLSLNRPRDPNTHPDRFKKLEKVCKNVCWMIRSGNAEDCDFENTFEMSLGEFRNSLVEYELEAEKESERLEYAGFLEVDERVRHLIDDTVEFDPGDYEALIRADTEHNRLQTIVIDEKCELVLDCCNRPILFSVKTGLPINSNRTFILNQIANFIASMPESFAEFRTAEIPLQEQTLYADNSVSYAEGRFIDYSVDILQASWAEMIVEQVEVVVENSYDSGINFDTDYFIMNRQLRADLDDSCDSGCAFVS